MVDHGGDVYVDVVNNDMVCWLLFLVTKSPKGGGTRVVNDRERARFEGTYSSY